MKPVDTTHLAGEIEQHVAAQVTTQAIADNAPALDRKMKKAALASLRTGKSKAPLRTAKKREVQVSHLARLLATREVLRERTANKVANSAPILTQDGEGIIWPHTINLIQGQTGTHKSRVAQLITSAFITDGKFNGEALGLLRSEADKPYAVCYVDTERNLQEQFVQAIQEMKARSGFEYNENPEHFDYTSLLAIPRTDRLEALREYLVYLRSTMSGHLVIVLDQLADCVADFNDPKESLLLTDLLNLMVNEQDVTFICVIHENPGGSKARGHLGTECANKASTVLQVGFIKTASGAPGNVLQMRYIKRRSGSPNLTLNVQFDAEKGELVRASSGAVADALDQRKRTALPGDVVAQLGKILTEPMPVNKLKEKLIAELGGNEKTIGQRLNYIVDMQTPVPDADGVLCKLHQEKRGRQVIYSLVPAIPGNKY